MTAVLWWSPAEKLRVGVTPEDIADLSHKIRDLEGGRLHLPCHARNAQQRG